MRKLTFFVNEILFLDTHLSSKTMLFLRTSVLRFSIVDSMSILLLVCKLPASQLFQARVSNQSFKIYSCKKPFANSSFKIFVARFRKLCSSLFVGCLKLCSEEERESILDFSRSDPKGHPLLNFPLSKFVLRNHMKFFRLICRTLFEKIKLLCQQKSII